MHLEKTKISESILCSDSIRNNSPNLLTVFFMVFTNQKFSCWVIFNNKCHLISNCHIMILPLPCIVQFNLMFRVALNSFTQRTIWKTRKALGERDLRQVARFVPCCDFRYIRTERILGLKNN